MTVILAFFASIPQFFYFLWAAFLRIFVSGLRANAKSDIEAGFEPKETDAKKNLHCSHPYHHDLESGIFCSASFSAIFVDVDLNSLSKSSKKPHEISDDVAIPFGAPIRRAGSPSGNKHVSDTLSELPGFPTLPGQQMGRWERRSRKRGSLLDLIRQFPEAPHHLPPGPKSLAVSLALAKADLYSSAVRNAACSSPASSETSASDSEDVSYGLAADDTPDTSAPGTPQMQVEDSFFAVSGQTDIVSHGKDNMAGFRFGGRPRGKALAWAALCRSQSNGSSFGDDSLSDSEQLEDDPESSACTGRRPVSIVWFADATLNAQTAPLCIVKKCKVAKVEDEVVTRELVRWEESRQRGLKAFREADGHYQGFFDLASLRT